MAKNSKPNSPRLIENTKKFDREYPIECRKKTGYRYLFLNPERIKKLGRIHQN